MSDDPKDDFSGSGGGGEERNAIAAEYVLGTLSSLEAESVDRAMTLDPSLADAIAGWEARLSPLTRLATPEAPPPELWARIEARIAPVPAASPVSEPGPRSSALLRWWAGGATLAAVGMAGLLVLPTSRTPPAQSMVPLATALVSDRAEPSWTATADADGTLRLAAVVPAGGAVPPPIPAGRVLQLWALPPEATAPTSLAVLAPGQTSLVLANPAVRPVPGMLIELTLEPTGGSPQPRPSGPVQFIGRLPQTS